MSSTTYRVIKNTGYLYAKMGVTMFVSLFTTRLILNGLGASDFGIFNIVGGAIAMLGFLNAAMASATQRFMSYAEGEGDKEKQKYIFNISIVLHLAIALIVGIALVGAGWIFFNGILSIPEDRVFAAEVVYASLILSTMFTVMSVPYDAVLNAHENMRYYAIVGIIESFLKLAVAFACVYTNSDKLIVYGILMAAIPLVTLTIMRVYCHHHYEECLLAPRQYYNKELLKEMTGFAGWNFLVSITTMVTQYGTGIIFNHFFGVLLNTAQGIANQLSGMLSTLTINAQKALNPILVKKAGEKNKEQLSYISILTCRVSFIIFGILAIPCINSMQIILSIWLKKVPEWTVIFCQLQLLRLLLEQPIIGIRTAINAYGKVKFYCIFRSISFVLPLLLIPLAFENGANPIWLYIIWIICWDLIEGAITIYFLVHFEIIKLRTVMNQLINPCLLIVAVCCLPMLFTTSINSYFQSIFSSIVLVTIFVVMVTFMLISKEERKLFKNILQKVSNS